MVTLAVAHGSSSKSGTGRGTQPQFMPGGHLNLARTGHFYLALIGHGPDKMRLCRTARGALSRDDCRGTYQPSIGTEIGGGRSQQAPA